MNITQQQNIIKHNLTELSTCENLTESESVRRTASPPDWTESQHADSESATFKHFTEDDFQEIGEQIISKLSPVSNTGATPTTPPHQKTKIDTLSVTLRESVELLRELLVESLKSEFRTQSIGFTKLKRGHNGYSYGYGLTINRREIAKIFYGCTYNEIQNEKPQVYIGGNGDTDYFDFTLMNHYLNQVDEPTIKRADIALDSYYGEVTLEDVKQAYIDGKYRNKNAPKNPKWLPIGGKNPIDGTHYGITYQIGSTSSMYYLRHYLKGYEIFKKQLDGYARTHEEMMIDRLFLSPNKEDALITVEGHNNDVKFNIRDWLRTELEMKSKNNQKLPLDCIIYTDQYFSGSFPHCNELLQTVEGIRPKYLKSPDELELEVRIQNMKNIAGSLLDDLIYLGWSNDEIIKVLRGGKGPSQKLIKSGLAMKLAPQDE